MRRLGSYQLSRMIGTGGMAQVWLARRSRLTEPQEQVAIKLLCAPLVHDARYREMFKEEAELTIQLSHPNIVRVFEVGEESGAQFIVMEWVDGMNLAHLSQILRDTQQKLSIECTNYIIKNLLQALVYIHSLRHPDGREMGLVHRDISPQNILIDRAGTIKLVDFGVARLVGKDTSGLHVKGKLRYMAPEQLHGDTIDQRADLYAVGAVMHELLSGVKFQSVQYRTPSLPDHFPETLRRVQQSLLNPDPKHRMESAKMALQQLGLCDGANRGQEELVAHLAEVCAASESKEQDQMASDRIERNSEDSRTVTQTSTYLAERVGNHSKANSLDIAPMPVPRTLELRWVDRNRYWIWGGVAVCLFSALIGLAMLASRY